MERIKDSENVVGWDQERTICKKGKTPCDTQHATQSHDGPNISDTLCVASLGSLEIKEPGQYDEGGGEGEEENHCVVSNVDDVEDVTVCYPAPWNKEIVSGKGRKKLLFQTSL